MFTIKAPYLVPESEFEFKRDQLGDSLAGERRWGIDGGEYRAFDGGGSSSFYRSDTRRETGRSTAVRFQQQTKTSTNDDTDTDDYRQTS